MIEELASRIEQLELCLEPGTASAIVNGVFKLAEEKCGHNPQMARHGLTTIRRWIDQANQKIEELAAQLEASELERLKEKNRRLAAEDNSEAESLRRTWCKDGESLTHRLQRERNETLLLMGELSRAKTELAEAKRDSERDWKVEFDHDLGHHTDLIFQTEEEADACIAGKLDCGPWRFKNPTNIRKFWRWRTWHMVTGQREGQQK